MVLAAIALFLVFSLRKDNGTGSFLSDTSSATVQVVDNEQKQIESFINMWCEYHSTGEPDKLSGLYAPGVKYYKSNYSREQVINSKRKLLNKNKGFAQSANAFRFENQGDGTRGFVTGGPCPGPPVELTVFVDRFFRRDFNRRHLQKEKRRAEALPGPQGRKKATFLAFVTILD